MKLRITVIHHTVTQIDVIIGQIEIGLREIRKMTVDGEGAWYYTFVLKYRNTKLNYAARLSIMGKGKGKTLVGTITVHCEPIDYKLLVSKTLIDAGRNARSCLIEAKEDLMSPAAEQSNISASLGSLITKLDIFVELVDKISEVSFLIYSQESKTEMIIDISVCECSLANHKNDIYCMSWFLRRMNLD